MSYNHLVLGQDFGRDLHTVGDSHRVFPFSCPGLVLLHMKMGPQLKFIPFSDTKLRLAQFDSRLNSNNFCSV